MQKLLNEIVNSGIVYRSCELPLKRLFHVIIMHDMNIYVQRSSRYPIYLHIIICSIFFRVVSIYLPHINILYTK